MEERYIRQSELVVRCIPSIAEESCFAIKGGTAINLFELDLPRLSVDIDLTFLPVTDRDTAIREINAALVRIAERLKARGLAVRMRGTEVSRKMACFANGAEIKIEPNFILRGTVYPVRQLELAPKMSEIVGLSRTSALRLRERTANGLSRSLRLRRMLTCSAYQGLRSCRPSSGNAGIWKRCAERTRENSQTMHWHWKGCFYDGVRQRD